MEVLPKDMVAEILLRLPIKPLFRFNCVSKRCKSIISEPKFGQKYVQRANSSLESSSSSRLLPSLMYPSTELSQYIDSCSNNVKNLTDTIDSSSQCHQDKLSIHISSVPPLVYGASHEILASSNGLILSFQKYHPTYRLFLYVSNPLTNQCMQLTKPNPRDSVLGFATRIAGHRVPTFLTYKIVLIRGVLGCMDAIVEIFSSDTGSWDALELRRCPGEVFNRGTAEASFAHKGMLYWLCDRRGSVITYDPFDSPDRFGSIRLPNGNNSSSGYRSLIYCGEEEMPKYCEIDECGPGVDRVSVWRLVDSGKGEWCVEGEFVVPSTLLYGCINRLMVATNLWNRGVVCHPYLIDNEVVVANLRSGRRKFMHLFEENARSFPVGMSSYSRPLVPIELCPWSSPFYASNLS